MAFSFSSFTNNVLSTPKACGRGEKLFPRLDDGIGRPPRSSSTTESSSSSSPGRSSPSRGPRLGPRGDHIRISAETLTTPNRGDDCLQARYALVGVCPNQGNCKPACILSSSQRRQTIERRETSPQSKEIKIMLLNLHKSKLSANELCKWDFDVALVQEPNLQRGGRVNLVQRPQSFFAKKGARAAIIINQGIINGPH